MFKDEKILEELRNITPKLSGGRSYCIVTRNADDTIEIHRRENQPCIGGEHRKYEKSHPGDCTRPNDPRPGDLRQPFPKGTPVALSYNWPIATNLKEFFEYVLSNESPWIKGFGGKKYIEFIPSTIKGYVYSGWIVKTAKIDPTVWINCLKYLQGAFKRNSFWKELIQRGMNKKEALVATILLSNTAIPPSVNGLIPSGDYTMSLAGSIKRIMEQDPVDLTGGTLRDRYDYNRPDMAKIFVDPDSKQEPFIKQLKDKLPARYSPEVFVKTVKQVIEANI